MDIIDFYTKGARVVVKGSGGSGMGASFGSKDRGGADVEIGYKPTAKAKPVSGPAHDVLKYNGATYLLLRGGYEYDVILAAGDELKDERISALGGHLAFQLPSGHTVSAVEAAEV